MVVGVNRMPLRIGSVVLLGVFVGGCVVPMPAPDAGKVLRIQGQASRDRGGETVPLVRGDRIAIGDRLNTGLESRLEVKLPDNTRVTLGAEAVLAVDKVTGEFEGLAGRTEISVMTGAFRTVAGHLRAGSDPGVVVHTPMVSIGIRGTDVWGGQSDAVYGVALLEGKVVVRNKAGEVTLDKPGYGTDIPGPDVAPTPPRAWNENRIKRALETVAFSHPADDD
ncbi:MAG: FecR domain-containing protein [Alphaproteobacteria bacterium]